MFNYRSESWDQPRLTHRDFRTLFETTNQAMMVEDRDGYIVSLNTAAQELWGSSGREMIGRHVAEFLPRELGTGGVGTIRRGHLRRPDQSTVELAVLSTPLTLGDEEAILTTSWPAEQASPTASDDRCADQAPGRRRCDPQAPKMAALGRLSERVSHDFNNVLTSIVGFASLMEADETLSGSNREYSRQIIAAARRAEELTGELLAFGRAPRSQAGHFDALQAINAAAPELRKILGAQISLTTFCEEGIPPIAGSADTLAKILIQLACNTREAMEGAADGVMKIELGRDESGWTHLTVSDDGPGMDEATLESAFEPFFSSPGDAGRSGLGLSRIYAATRSLGGRVRISSQCGTGTELSFRFPPAPVASPALEDFPEPAGHPVSSPAEIPATDHQPQQAEAKVEAEAEKPEARVEPKRSGSLPGGTETILVVEDEPMVREIVVRSLTHLGYTVYKASDGQAGLERSRELADEIDLIFSDIVMPRLSGPEMMQKVRQENRDTPVLFTTGFTESKHLLENGGDLREGIDLLQKPYTPSVLADRIREKLDSLIS